MRSRAADSLALYDLTAAFTAGTAALGFGARELTRARNAECRLEETGYQLQRGEKH